MVLAAVSLLEPLHSQLAREDGTPPEQTLGGLLAIGLALVILSLVHIFFRRLKKKGVMDYDEERVGRGLGNAMGALGALLQPNHAPPENLPTNIEVVDQDFSGGDPAQAAPTHLVNDPNWPSDGLRTGGKP